METVCVTGEHGTGVHDPAVISSGHSEALHLDQSVWGMPTGLTGWRTSVPFRRPV